MHIPDISNTGGSVLSFIIDTYWSSLLCSIHISRMQR